MADWIEKIREFVGQPHPRFLCFGAGGLREENKKFVARVNNYLHKPPSSEEIKRLKSITEEPLPEDFLEFYSRFNGITLYQDSLLNTSGFAAVGIYIAPISDWEQLQEGMQDWLEPISDEDDDSDWFENAIVFGEVPNSGNYFFLSLSGSKKGKIIYFSHDGLEFEEYASGLAEFLEKITLNPAKVLYDLGCYARYTDGNTDIQWIPESYSAGDDPI